jgi:hypothetical protein
VRRKRIDWKSADAVPDAWLEIWNQRKTLLTWPVWPEVQPLPTGRRFRSVRSELRTAAAETIEVVVPLGDRTGVGLEGVRLRIIAWAFKRLHEVTATLEVQGGRSFVTIARLDAWPADPHMNLIARKHPAFRRYPVRIDGHHVHRFRDNAKLGLSAFAPQGNLPVAIGIPDSLGSFRDFLRILATEFRIDGVDEIDPPDWQVML